MLSKEDLEKAWSLLGKGSFESGCDFIDQYAIKLLEGYEKQMQEIEKLKQEYSELEDQASTWREESGN